MATAVEAPASITAEGPTSHTQNQLAELAARLESLLDQSSAHGYTRAEQIEALHKLREPFATQEIRHRPQPYCKACSDTKGWPKVCQRHSEIRCERCKTKVTEAHICLRFVGHAEATNRLLNTDPFWDWEPLALDQVGLPQYDGNRGMWIRLTVCGVTRIGYGDAGTKTGANAVKEIIGDAIRNAGMRFGMALNLWTSSELEILEPGVELAPELAAELGGPGGDASRGRQPESTTPAAAPTPAAAAAPKQSAPSRDEVLDKLYLQAIGNRSHIVALKQIVGAAKAEKVIDMEVEGPPPTRERMTLGALIDLLLADAQAANAERSAA